MRRLIALAGLLGLMASMAWAENWFQSVSVTATSQTITLPTARKSVMLCSYGDYIAYFRIFNEFEATGAATTAYSPIPAGSATAPVCKSFVRPDTEPANIKAISFVCDTAETATVTIDAY